MSYTYGPPTTQTSTNYSHIIPNITYGPATQINTTTATLTGFSYPAPKTLLERLADIKKVEELKKLHKLGDFHIVMSNDYFVKYIFLTNTEMEYLHKYNISVDLLKTPEDFEYMINQKSENHLILGAIGKTYSNIDDLRKDYLILQLSALEQ